MFGIWAANLWIFRENFLLVLSKLQYPLLKKRFWWKKILFEKLWIQVLRNLAEFFLFLPTKLRQACQNFVVFVQTIILTNRFFGKLVKFSSFPKFSGICRENFGRVVTTAFWVSRWLLRKNILFRKKMNCYLFGTWRKRFSVLLAAWLRQACQKFVVHVQTKIFTKKFFGRLIIFSSFPEIQQKIFRVLTRKFRLSGHNYFYTCT